MTVVDCNTHPDRNVAVFQRAWNGIPTHKQYANAYHLCAKATTCPFLITGLYFYYMWMVSALSNHVIHGWLSDLARHIFFSPMLIFLLILQGNRNTHFADPISEW